jgi:uncharacterized membrane protein
MFFGSLGIVGAIIGFVYNLVMAIVGVFLFAFIVAFLSPTFGSEKNFDQSLKVAAYSFTPVWIASVTMMIPLLGQLIVLLAICYGVYVFYLGLQIVKKTPEDKLVPYTAVAIVVALIAGMVIGTIGFLITGAGAMGVGSSVPRRCSAKSRKLDDFSSRWTR